MQEMEMKVEIAMQIFNFEKYVSSPSKLINSFEIRFPDFQEDKGNITIFTNPFIISIADLDNYPVLI
jgi:hypothetical protein